MRWCSSEWSCLETTEVLFCRPLDVVCFSHTLDNVGSHFEFQVLDSFTRFWIGFFSHSYNARLVCMERENWAVNSYLQRHTVVEQMGRA